MPKDSLGDFRFVIDHPDENDPSSGTDDVDEALDKLREIFSSDSPKGQQSDPGDNSRYRISVTKSTGSTVAHPGPNKNTDTNNPLGPHELNP